MFAIVPLLMAALALSSRIQAQEDQNTNDGNTTTLCGTSSFYNSTDSQVPYSFNNNAWGANGSEWGATVSTGFSCLTIGDGGRNFSVSYKWEGDASTVKAFPYAKAWPSNFPMQLKNLSSMPFSASWRTYVNGTEGESDLKQAEAFDTAALRANVAVDMFLSANETNSTEVGPPIEIMIWPWYTKTILPLGYASSTPENDTVDIGGVKYSMYQGYNIQGQHVFSWLAHENLTQVDVDYAPLISYIVEKGDLNDTLYLGQLEFGTEVMNANQQATFEAWDYSLRLVPNNGTTTTRSTATPTRTTSSTSTNAVTITSTSATQSATASASTTTSKSGAATSLPRLQVWAVGGTWVCGAVLAAI